jgi:hypothetical protein
MGEEGRGGIDVELMWDMTNWLKGGGMVCRWWVRAEGEGRMWLFGMWRGQGGGV